MLGTSNKAMVSEIAENILLLSQQNILFSMSSIGALKIDLYREKRKLNPLT
jgi:hypothetical protein